MSATAALPSSPGWRQREAAGASADVLVGNPFPPGSPSAAWTSPAPMPPGTPLPLPHRSNQEAKSTRCFKASTALRPLASRSTSKSSGTSPRSPLPCSMRQGRLTPALLGAVLHGLAELCWLVHERGHETKARPTVLFRDHPVVGEALGIWARRVDALTSQPTHPDGTARS